MNAGAIDAVSLSIMWDRLIGITDEIISALVRSSFSTRLACRAEVAGVRGPGRRRNGLAERFQWPLDELREDRIVQWATCRPPECVTETHLDRHVQWRIT